ncbi:MAG: hypothetical protein GAK44_00194 [Pseudomonas delhiensis]|nr:MAG: hypothetical protein GAK44_00194 [Pseudomonas delhiensis]
MKSIRMLLAATVVALSTVSAGAFMASAQAATPKASVVAEQSSQININTADAEGLQAGLIGIGKTKAQAIVDYRKDNGAFTSVDQLLEVKGIGKSTLEKNRDRITVK